MQTITEDQKARIAAEVAARYGVICKPDVVQIVPRGASAFAVEYLWTGRALEPVVKTAPGEVFRRTMGNGVREAARKRRLAELAEKEAIAIARRDAIIAKAAQREAEKIAAKRAAEEAAARRVEGVRAICDKGGTIVEVMAFLNMQERSAWAFCARFGLTPVHRKSTQERQKAESERRAEVARAFVADGAKTLTQIAQHVGLSRKSVRKFCQRHGIEWTSARPVVKRLKPDPRLDVPANAPGKALEGRSVEAIAAEVAARRERVAQMRADGMGCTAIARALGVAASTVSNDINVLNLRVNPPVSTVFRPHLVRRAVLLRQGGASYREIGKAIQVSPQTARRMCIATEAA